MDRLHRAGRWRTVRDELLTGLWFVPLLMIGGAGLLAGAGHALDAWLAASDHRPLPWLIYSGSADNARDVLSGLLASMVTMTTLVFSVTMVVLTLAANQFGPRLIRNFTASRQTQLVLGTFVMTIFYCLLMLSAIGSRGREGTLSFPSVSIAVALMGLSILLLVLFIHNLARSIMSETVIELVGREVDQVFDELEPLPEGATAVPGDDPQTAVPEGFERNAAFFGPKAAGYVQAVEFESLISIAQDASITIGFFFRPGDYVAQDGGGIAVFPAKQMTPELAEKINEAITLGIHRTPVQDPEFAIRHLVEIAVRALSPGTNDPYTAIAVIHRVSASLARLMGRSLPEAVFRDARGVVRVICPRPTYASLVSGAFDQIRQNGADKPIVLIHLLEALIRIAPHALLPEQVESLREQLRNVLHAGERAIASPSDLADLKRRGEKATKALDLACSRQ